MSRRVHEIQQPALVFGVAQEQRDRRRGDADAALLLGDRGVRVPDFLGEAPRLGVGCLD